MGFASWATRLPLSSTLQMTLYAWPPSVWKNSWPGCSTCVVPSGRSTVVAPASLGASRLMQPPAHLNLPQQNLSQHRQVSSEKGKKVTRMRPRPSAPQKWISRFLRPTCPACAASSAALRAMVRKTSSSEVRLICVSVTPRPAASFSSCLRKEMSAASWSRGTRNDMYTLLSSTGSRPSRSLKYALRPAALCARATRSACEPRGGCTLHATW
mmetsp:Transcript_18478/g.46769  ORF Transcript_18478/g.46769 Transcript_18478/m.46769 type:complete len:212 (-) Transcript_18478:1484-2119(-)